MVVANVCHYCDLNYTENFLCRDKLLSNHFFGLKGQYMATITLRGDDAAFMQDLSAQLAQDLQRVGLDADVQLTTPSATEATRGDPAVLAIIATAVAAGGALTVFLGKDGGLSALAKVLEKYIESRKVEVAIETDDGKKVKVSGSLTAIKAVLKEV